MSFFAALLALAPYAQNAPVAAPLNAFSYDLMAHIPAAKDQNVFASPFSVGSCLALLLPGVGTNDRAALTKALHLAKAQNPEQQLAALTEQVQDAPGQGLQVADSVWTVPGVALKPAYKQAVQTQFHAAATELKGIGDLGAAQINLWVSDHTQGRINRLVDKVTKCDRVILVNAVVFDGTWDSQFALSQTKDLDFHAPQGTVKVPTMHQTHSFAYAELGPTQVLDLPYTTDYDMVIFLPEKGDDPLKALLSANTQQILDLRSHGDRARVDLLLPKFRFSTRYDLTPTLAKLGLGRLTNHLDASKMLEEKQPVAITQVVHAAYVEVDEKGTKAAAATGVRVGITAIPYQPKVVEFHVDRPFAFQIVSRKTGAILFLGAVYDPSKP